jgi:hypothetical protein
MVGGGATALANAVVVSGAGTAEANGTYSYDGTVDGATAYRSGDYRVFYTGGRWVLFNEGPDVELYESAQNVVRPWLSAWSVLSGDALAPTLSPARA